LIIELKSVEEILPVYQAQLLSYMKLSGKKTGLILNFNVQLLKDGIKRMVL
jgi:GxxExxY protein